MIEGVVLDWIWNFKNVSVFDLFFNKFFGGIVSNLSNMGGFIDNVIMGVIDIEVKIVVFNG